MLPDAVPDTLDIAVAGALSTDAIPIFEKAREEAAERQEPVLVTIGSGKVDMHISGHGMRGGYLANSQSDSNVTRQSTLNQWHDRKKKNGLQKFLAIHRRIVDRTELFADRPGMHEGVLDEHLSKIEGCAQRKLRDHLGVNGAGVHGTSSSVRFWQQLEQIGFERPKPLIQKLYSADLVIGDVASHLHPIFILIETEDLHRCRIQHEISLADTALVPCWTQRDRLRLTACLESFSRSATTHIRRS